MVDRIADDFAGIARGMAALREAHPPKSEYLWWCCDCRKVIPESDVCALMFVPPRHDESVGGCGCWCAPVCETCNNSGWVDNRLGGIATSGWPECPDCGNPLNQRQP